MTDMSLLVRLVVVVLVVLIRLWLESNVSMEREWTDLSLSLALTNGEDNTGSLVFTPRIKFSLM